MRQKHNWSYIAFSQIWLVEGKIVPAVLLPYDLYNAENIIHVYNAIFSFFTAVL